MKRKTLFVLFVLVIVLVAAFSGIAFAEGAAGHESSMMSWIWKFLNFAILVVVLVVFMRKPLVSYLKTRTELIEKSIKEASEAKSIAEKALLEVEERLRLKDQEIQRIIESSIKSGEGERDSLVEDGRKMSERIIEQAKMNIEYELKKAKEQLKSDASLLSIELAENKIKQRLSEKEQLEILEESLRKLEG